MALLFAYFLFGLVSFYQAFLVKRNPEKIRGLRKLKDEHRGIQYEAGMQKVYFVNYLITGFLWVITGVIGYFFGMKLTYLMLFLGLVGWLIVVISKWRYMVGVPKWNWVLLAACVVLMASYHLWMRNGSKVELRADTFCVEGDYGLEMPYQAIDSVFVMETMPEVKYTKDGYSVFGNKKGLFRLNDGSDAKFYLLGKQPPYLKMYTHGGLVFVNRKTTAETEQLIEELKSRVGEKFVE